MYMPNYADISQEQDKERTGTDFGDFEIGATHFGGEIEDWRDVGCRVARAQMMPQRRWWNDEVEDICGDCSD